MFVSRWDQRNGTLVRFPRILVTRSSIARPISSFHHYIHVRSSTPKGFKLDTDTFEWWKGTPDAARVGVHRVLVQDQKSSRKSSNT